MDAILFSELEFNLVGLTFSSSKQQFVCLESRLLSGIRLYHVRTYVLLFAFFNCVN